MEQIVFENRVIKYLCEELELQYNSRLRYFNEGTQYRLEWILNDQDHPYIMMGDFESEDDFFEYVKKEIQRTRLYLKKYYVAIMDTTNTRL